MSHETTPQTDHRAEAVRHLEATKAYRLQLLDTYEAPNQDRARIAELHQAIGFGLKVAEIHAQLAVAVSAERFGDLSQLQAERFGSGSRLS